MSKGLRNILIGVVGLVVLVFGGLFVYVNFVEDPPDRLTLDDVPTVTTAADDGTSDTTATGGTTDTTGSGDAAAGTFTVAEGSQAGYRVSEELAGVGTEAVGRTTGVTGELVLNGTVVESAGFTVDMTTVASDRSQRDGQFNGRIMSTSEYPTATFELTEPIDLGELPADGEEITVSATGDLTLRGVTNSVTFDLTARIDGSTIAVVAAIPVNFDDFEIPDASGGPAQVGRDGTVEVALALAAAS